ncbi:MAG: hypothetical protein DRR19_11725 [Candidatus Parabeggiatoa sp. nov. 1]|nr:MAG: hypothetical protein DRR19_11725 [Gammaproteobacteria bacterium]
MKSVKFLTLINPILGFSTDFHLTENANSQKIFDIEFLSVSIKQLLVVLMGGQKNLNIEYHYFLGTTQKGMISLFFY